VDPAATASYSRRPASNASTLVIGVAKAWVVRFVVRFVRIAFLGSSWPATFHGLRLCPKATGRRTAISVARVSTVSQNFAERRKQLVLPLCRVRAVPNLCQNPICLECRELLFEREQLSQVIDNKHFRIELIEFLERVTVLRNISRSPVRSRRVAP
jgi:hypothetical protein